MSKTFKEALYLIIGFVLALAFVAYWIFWFEYTKQKFIDNNQEETWNEIWGLTKEKHQ